MEKNIRKKQIKREGKRLEIAIMHLLISVVHTNIIHLTHDCFTGFSVFVRQFDIAILSLCLVAFVFGDEPDSCSRQADNFVQDGPPPLGLPFVEVPKTNPLTDIKIALGKQLFFDRRLSFNGTLSCAMCHIPEQGFSQNELATPVGFEGRSGKRNSPTLLNVAYRRVLFHDGRELSLENQIWSPLLNPAEMANPSIGIVLARIEKLTDYPCRFQEAFGKGPTVETVGMALASYQRTLLSGNSAFDRWRFAGEKNAMTREARKGFKQFVDKGCSGCHLINDRYADFTDDDFHDTGIGYYQSMLAKESPTRQVSLAPGVQVEASIKSPRVNDLGRYEATGNSIDRWKYRTPTLRNVALTPPYMHDGSLPTLTDVINHYNNGGIPHPGQDPRIVPLGLQSSDIRNLVVFLEALTGDNVAELIRQARDTDIGDY